MTTAYDFTATDIDGQQRALREFAGQAAADRQRRLEVRLHAAVPRPRGAVAQAPATRASWCSAFRATSSAIRSPATRAEIKQFCSLNYDVTFPLFAKVEVNGDGTHPLYQWLKGEKPGVLGTEAIKWNFTKFLVDRSGQVVKRYAPTDTPEKIDKHLGGVLAEAARP